MTIQPAGQDPIDTQNWLAERGFTSTEPGAVYEAIKPVLGQTDWSKHGLVFAEGRVQVVDGEGDEIYYIARVTEYIFSAGHLEPQARAELLQSMDSLFYAHGQPLKIVVTVIDEGVEHEESIPLSVVADIPPLAGELLNAYKTTYQLTLPPGTDIKTFRLFVTSKIIPDIIKILNFTNAVSLLIFCNYCCNTALGNLCIDTISLRLRDITDFSNLDEILGVLVEGKLYHRYASLVVSQYIRTSLLQGVPIQTISQTLSNIPSLQSVPLNLDLSRIVIRATDLTSLAEALPHVATLNLSKTQLQTLPPVWQHSLKSLDISFTDIIAIPAGFSQLTTLNAAVNHRLIDISGLNGLQHLFDIDLRHTGVNTKPQNCPALTIFQV